MTKAFNDLKAFPLPESEDQEDPINPPLTDIHQCLQAAAHQTRLDQPMINFSVRMQEEMKNQAQGICKQNMTDLGTFLRECTKSLVKDYGASTED